MFSQVGKHYLKCQQTKPCLIVYNQSINQSNSLFPKYVIHITGILNNKTKCNARTVVFKKNKKCPVKSVEHSVIPYSLSTKLIFLQR